MADNADLFGCRRGEFGLTEENEPVMVVARDGTVLSHASSPMLQPWIIHPAAASVLYGDAAAGGAPPLPVVVLGHFDDPRAMACLPKARDACRAGFVIDAVVSVNGRPALPKVPSPSLLEQGPLDPDMAALSRLVVSAQQSGERLLTAVVANGWNGSLFDERIRFKLAGPTWFLTFLEPDGSIRSVGIDQRTGATIWPIRLPH